MKGARKKKKHWIFWGKAGKEDLVERANYLECLSGSFHLPPDLLEGSVLISVMGNRSVRVENYMGIMEYTQECIKLQTKNGKLVLEGRQLNMDYCTDVELHVTGKIQQIHFL